MDMKKLKIGQSFEVVKVLTDGGYYNTFNLGGFTIGEKSGSGFECLSNNVDNTDTIRYRYMSTLDEEVKPVGKLTITKLKDTV